MGFGVCRRLDAEAGRHARSPREPVEALGHRGTDARLLIRRQRFDPIVLDPMLPGEDGLSIHRRLRGQGVETPIVTLTAKGDEADRIVGLEIGADDYVPKPDNPR